MALTDLANVYQLRGRYSDRRNFDRILPTKQGGISKGRSLIPSPADLAAFPALDQGDMLLLEGGQNILALGTTV